MIDDGQARMFFCNGVEERHSLVADPTLENADKLWREWLETHDRQVEQTAFNRRLPDTPGLWRDTTNDTWLVW